MALCAEPIYGPRTLRDARCGVAESRLVPHLSPKKRNWSRDPFDLNTFPM